MYVCSSNFNPYDLNKWIKKIILKFRNRKGCYEQSKTVRRMSGTCTGNHSDLQWVIGAYRGWLGLTGDDRGVQGMTGAYRGWQGMCTRAGRRLQGVQELCIGADRGAQLMPGKTQWVTGKDRDFHTDMAFFRLKWMLKSWINEYTCRFKYQSVNLNFTVPRVYPIGGF